MDYVTKEHTDKVEEHLCFLGGGFNFFFIFIPKIGEDSHFD